MAEENQVTPKEHQVTPQVTTRNPKKVERGGRLAEYNPRKKEELKPQKSEGWNSGVSQYYGFGAVIAVRVIGGIGYYIY